MLTEASVARILQTTGRQEVACEDRVSRGASSGLWPEPCHLFSLAVPVETDLAEAGFMLVFMLVIGSLSEAGGKYPF